MNTSEVPSWAAAAAGAVIGALVGGPAGVVLGLIAGGALDVLRAHEAGSGAGALSAVPVATTLTQATAGATSDSVLVPIPGDAGAIAVFVAAVVVARHLGVSRQLVTTVERRALEKVRAALWGPV